MLAERIEVTDRRHIEAGEIVRKRAKIVDKGRVALDTGRRFETVSAAPGTRKDRWHKEEQTTQNPIAASDTAAGDFGPLGWSPDGFER